MDTLTHALSGALLARATAPRDAPPRSLPRRIAAGFFACAAPDLDFVFAFLGPVEYVELHRGPTHSLLLLPFWALVFSWVLAKMLREPRGWKALYVVTALGLGLHIAGDVITSYGTMIFWPLSDWRAAIGTTFIIDLWFTGIILAGLLLSIFFRNTKKPSVAALALLAGYVALQYWLKQEALEFGAQYARQKGIVGAAVDAEARPVSPFNWTVFVSDAERHRFSHVNLVRKEAKPYRPGDGFIARIDSPFLPLDEAVWVSRARYGETDQALIRDAWESPPLAFFRWFAALPAFAGMSAGSQCVWFVDLRFLSPGRDDLPFEFGACRAGPGTPWRAYDRNRPAAPVR
ncbi:MAG: metal-dependent hydrolase [Clostridia bacterium]